jgi:PII-like signaling protein
VSQAYAAKLLRILISECDRFGGKPLYEAIVARCRDMRIAGATVFRGVEGYGETAEMHRAHLVRHDQPIIITIVDSTERLAALAVAVEGMMDTGLMALSDVRVIRVQKRAGATDGTGD